MSYPTKDEHLWTRDFILVCIYNPIVFASFHMLMPIFPLYVGRLGGGDTTAGIVTGLFAISSVAIRPWVGRGLDNYGRLGIWFAGAVIFFIINFGYIWALTVPLLMALRVVHGLGWGVITTASATAATDLIPASRRGEGMGFFGLGVNLGMVIGPPIGFFIANKVGFTKLFGCSGLLAIAAFIVLTVIRLPKINTVSDNHRVNLWEPTAVKPSLYLFFATFVYGGVLTFVALYGQSINITNAGVFFSVYAVSLIITRPISGMLFDRYGHKVVITPGFLLLGTGLIILSLSWDINLFVLSAIILGVGFGSVHPALQALSVAQCAPNRRGAAQATFTASFDLGLGLGSILLGVLAQYVGYSMMYLSSSIVVAIGLFTYLLLGIPSGLPLVSCDTDK